MILGIIFSKDRAMQLDAALHSFYMHCADPAEVQMHVIFKTSSEQHAGQYAGLGKAYPGVQFHAETVFRDDLLNLIRQSVRPGWEVSLSRKIRKLRRQIPWLQDGLSFLDLPRYLLFLVDDNLFVQDFALKDIAGALAARPQALGFSLRLGLNINYSYPVNKNIAPPLFTPVGRHNICIFPWKDADPDLNYPLEVSSSVYRLDEVHALLENLTFENPNRLEAQLARRAGVFSESQPYLLCYNPSAAFCNPVNRVQDMFRNRAGETVKYSSDELANFFDRGQRVDVKQYSGLVPSACHQEVELQFTNISL